jgi:hypothetical protein
MNNSNVVKKALLSFIFGFFVSSALPQEVDVTRLETGSKLTATDLGELIPFIKETPFNKIKLKEVTVEAIKETALVQAHIILKGTVDLSAISAEIPFLKNEPTTNLILKATIYTPSKRTVLKIQLQKNVFFPFKEITIPGLKTIDADFTKSIKITDCALGLRFTPGKDAMIFLEGGVDIFNLKLTARVMYWKTTNSKTGKVSIGPTLKVSMPNGWKFSDSFPGLSALDVLEFEEVFIYLSSISFEDKEIETRRGQRAFKIEKGLTLYGNLKLKKSFPILQNASVAPDNIIVYGTISKDQEKLLIGANLPNLIKLKKGPIKAGGTALEISGKPAVMLILSVLIKPTKQDEELRFTARISAAQKEGSIGLTMDGLWENVFGIEGLKIGNVALQLDANYKILFTTGMPSTLGFTGSMDLGVEENAKTIQLSGMFGEKIVIHGQLDGSISIREIVNTAKSFAINAAEKGLPGKAPQHVLKKIDSDFKKIFKAPAIKQILDTECKNVNIKIVPETTFIGEYEYIKGVTIRGEIELIGTTVGLNMVLSPSGIISEGWVTPIQIGNVFSLKGAGLDKKYGTDDDAAIMSLALNFERQALIISGIVELLGIKQQTEISLDKDGLKFFVEGKIGNLFDAKVDVKSVGNIKDPDLIFKASLKNDFREALIREIKKSLNIENVKVSMKNQPDASHLLAANFDVESDEFIRFMNGKPKYLAKLGDWIKKKAGDVKKKASDIKEKTEDLGEKIGDRLEDRFKDVAKGFEDFGQAFKKIGAKALIRALNGMHIKKMSIDGSVKQMVNGTFPRIQLEFVIFKKTLLLDVQVDFDDMAQTMENIIKEMLGKIKLALKL